MKLRDHPLLKRSNSYSSCGWPPIWTNTRPDPNDKPQGEIGNLQQVLRRQDLAEILFLVIQYQNRRYMGAMRFDDDAFCQEIYALLQSQLGLSIKEIGDVDVSHLP